MERGKVLDKAKDIINGERQDVYGDPEDSFKVIADYWSTFLCLKITSKDVALMMTLFKIAREQNQHKIDNLIDAAGYIGIAGDIEESCPSEKLFDFEHFKMGGEVTFREK